MKIKDIAGLAGVSIATVSKIINNKDEAINPKTREKVLEIVKKYNYTPYNMIKQSTDKHTFTLAIIFKGNEVNNTILNNIIKTSQKRNYSILIYLSDFDLEKELQHITSIVKNNVDGVIWETVSDESFINKSYFEKNDIKYLYLNSKDSGYFIDFSKGIYLATKKLIEKGHKNILFFGGENEEEKKSFKKAFFEENIIFNDKFIISNLAELENILVEKKVTGIITKTMVQAKFLKSKLKDMRYKIPEDVSLLTFSNDETSSQISFFNTSEEKMAESITENLIAICEKREYNNSFSQNFLLNNENTIKDIENNNKKIVVIGSINTDITLNVEEFPSKEKTIVIDKHLTSIGGKGINQTLGVHKMGVPISLIGKIGDDVEGRKILSRLSSEGIEVNGIEKDSSYETGRAYIYLKRDGESTISIFPGANNKLSPNDIEKNQNLFKNCCYCLISTEIPEPCIKKVIEIAKINNSKIILKPSSRKEVSNEILKEVEILVLNKTEFKLLSKNKKNIDEGGQYFLKNGVKNIIITSIKDGYTFINKEKIKKFPSIDFPSIDITGSSDIFIATLASYLTRDFKLENSIEIATYAAAFSTLHQGPSNGLMDRTSLEAYIEKVNPNLLKI